MIVREDVLTKIGKFSLEKIEDRGEFLITCAMEIARVMCMDQDFQFVIMEVFKLKNRKAYQIFFGMPQDSLRHGIGEVGLLEEPVRKEALLLAIRENVPVVVNDVLQSSLTEYMKIHAINKNIERLVILPISFNHNQWLLVFDRLMGKQEFSLEDEEFLKRGKVLIEKAFWAQEEIQSRRAKDVLEQSNSFLRGIEDAFRNPLSTAFLAIERAKKELNNGVDKEEVVENWLGIAQESIRRAMNRVDLLEVIQDCSVFEDKKEDNFVSLESFLKKIKNGQQKEEDYLGGQFIVVKNVLALEKLIFELDRYLARSKGQTFFSVERDQKKKRAIFLVEASCFFPDKERKELELLIICNLAKIAGGDAKIRKQGKLEISFPLFNGVKE